MNATDPIAMTLDEMLRHDRDRIGRLELASGRAYQVREVIETGDGWMLILVGFGEGEEKVYVRTAAVAAVALRTTEEAR